MRNEAVRCREYRTARHQSGYGRGTMLNGADMNRRLERFNEIVRRPKLHLLQRWPANCGASIAP